MQYSFFSFPISAPTQRRVPVQVVNKYNGTYLVEYSPSEVGEKTYYFMYLFMVFFISILNNPRDWYS